MYKVTFRAPGNDESEKVALSFSHDESTTKGYPNDAAGRVKFNRPPREAGKLLSVSTESESVAKILADILSKDFDDVAIIES